MIIAGRRIRLRDWSVDDLDAYAHWLQPDHKWHALDGPYYKKASAAEIPDLIERIRTRIVEGNFPDPRERFIIAAAEHDQMIGMVSRYWISEETHWLALGIAIYDPALWGQGLGYEALGLWTDYLFRSLPQIARLDLQTWSGNAGMIGLANKLGYQREGCFRNARIVNGAYYDALGFGILREEWEAQHPRGFGQ